jgi:hypothetical protein
MKKENQKIGNCERIKRDKDKREFIKKSLLGIGTAGIVAGVLASPLGSSLTTINTTSLSATSTNNVTGWNSYKLDSQIASYYRCSSGCSWTCSGTCVSGCLSGCINACNGCLGTCSATCRSTTNPK